VTILRRHRIAFGPVLANGLNYIVGHSVIEVNSCVLKISFTFRKINCGSHLMHLSVVR